MKRCIIFSRVSSLSQEYTEQTARVRRLAEQYGYDEHIIIEEKESGIKLSEEERLGLNKMKQYIQNDPDIDCLFCFEVSRLARTKKVLFSVEEYLVKNHIQLNIVEPRLTLLNPDGSINDSADVCFTIYAQQAESEMRIKKERFKNGKTRCRKAGIWDGTPLPFGYGVDEHQKVILSDQADKVRLIYNLYSSSEWSTTTLAKELNKRGVHDENDIPLSQSRIARILSTERYCGEDIYPQIITRELYNKVKELRSNAKVLRKNNYASQYLCNRLIVCPECGHHYSPGSTTYRCFMHHKDKQKCTMKIEVNIDMMDDIAWACARDLEVSELMRQNQSKQKDLEIQLSVLSEKKEALEKKLLSFSSKTDKVQDMYVDGLIDREKLHTRLKKIQDDKVHIEEEMKAVCNDYERITALKDTMINNHLSFDDIEKLNDSLPEDVEKKRQIVRSHLKSIHFEAWLYENVDFVKKDLITVEIKKKRYMLIIVNDKYGFTRKWKYYPKWTYGQKGKLIEVSEQ